MSTLDQYLKEKQIVQSAFAEVLGVTQATVSRLCKQGAAGPSFDLAVQIERATDGGVPVYSWPRFRAIAPTQAAE